MGEKVRGSDGEVPTASFTGLRRVLLPVMWAWFCVAAACALVWLFARIDSLLLFGALFFCAAVAALPVLLVNRLAQVNKRAVMAVLLVSVFLLTFAALFLLLWSFM